ncbi:hypothetical protein CC1G_05232 [Coprinopsis cinerea okayama7|uniref:F-box domain-containing protein n=1 Tax=Coprinopsis cinerea (strain Okayama-7 / 130 / ATCC MYA-4618 / FGSC 9003) TaxID=240176 RepID=A8PC94_COPC7|nr:hypothetical protein CC1G_05232 [Coprinopsis cinerea okayama7\|eukprot:XP_001840346.2 hypothetical protein CC1G_05232 [Coprinopsis cinerea okayama7\
MIAIKLSQTWQEVPITNQIHPVRGSFRHTVSIVHSIVFVVGSSVKDDTWTLFTMGDLPSELWTVIAQFLSPDDIADLMFLNRTFLDLALDEKYKELKMEKLNVLFCNKLWALKSPDYARRVRTVHLQPLLLHERENVEQIRLAQGPPSSESPSPSRIKTYATRLYHRFFDKTGNLLDHWQDDVPAAVEISQMLMEVIPFMTNVRSFTLMEEGVVKLSAPYIDIAWRTIAPRLEELSLWIHPRRVEDLLPLGISFPVLKKLSIQFPFQAPTTTAAATSLQARAVTSFINQFQDTLQHLHLGSCNTWDAAHLYSLLGRFPHLASFEMIPYNFNNTEPVFEFMKRHADVLQHLTYVSCPSIQANGLSELTLQKLTKLTLKLNYIPYPDAWWTQPSPFLDSIVPTLRCLHIKGPLVPDELTGLLTSLTQGGQTSPPLQELSFSINSLSVETLAMISMKLPNLLILDLRIHDLIAPGAYPTSPGEFFPFSEKPTTHLFEVEVGQSSPLEQPHPFSDQLREAFSTITWTLEDITLKRHSCCGELLLWGLMVLCAECIPSIQSFARRGTRRIPSPANQKPRGRDLMCSSAMCCFGRDGTNVSMRKHYPP